MKITPIMACITIIALAWLANWGVSRSHAHPASNLPPQCTAAHDAANAECATDMENLWNNEGAANYSREQRIKDTPICNRIAEAAANACRGAQ